MQSTPQTVTVDSLYQRCRAMLRRLFEKVSDELLGFAELQVLVAVLGLGLEGKTVEAQHINGIDYWFQDDVERIVERFSSLKQRDSERYTKFVEYAKSYIDEQLKHQCKIVIDELSLAIKQSNGDDGKDLVAACKCIVSKYEYPACLKIKSKYSEVENFQTAHDRLKATNQMLFKHFITYFSSEIEQKCKDVPDADIEHPRTALANMPIFEAPERSLGYKFMNLSVNGLFQMAKKAELDPHEMEELLDMLDSVLKGKTLTTDIIDRLHHVLHDYVALFHLLHSCLKQFDSERFKQFVAYAENSIKHERQDLNTRVIDNLSKAIRRSNGDDRNVLLNARSDIVFNQPVKLDNIPDKWQEEVQAFQKLHNKLKQTNETMFKHFEIYLGTKMFEEWGYIQEDDSSEHEEVSPAKKQKV